MCDSGGAQPDCSPEPGPLHLTWVVGECRVPGLSCVQGPWQVLGDGCGPLVGGGEEVSPLLRPLGGWWGGSEPPSCMVLRSLTREVFGSLQWPGSAEGLF